MPVTKEFVEQYVVLLVEQGPAKTKTVAEMQKIVARGEQVDVDVMFSDRDLEQLFHVKDPIHRLVYGFVRDNQDLFVKHGPKANDPVANIQNWGREIANQFGWWLVDIVYDDAMLHFMFLDDDNEELRAATVEMRNRAIESNFIKAPYVIGAFERNEALDSHGWGVTAYTMWFENMETV